ncbi:serine/threonine protein kinase [Photobacterium damselae subsp. damselae]|uniref:serine/threonine protein kinase n=1 Tax=Photobacterium damselae TaxID=38293 RepID=UPI001F27FC12|nr:serine/threonine protein kinase [Photobacterium damselae]UKA06979.1 serine/threonine protein kinase [Photobacterium damselae subsp. damselae]UKA22084.1 serine/threonine protein kinase [Photobacterium damselae subsp. damselae]
MKIKLLTTLIAGALLAGCGSDNDNSVTPQSIQLQAYDPEVRGMDVTFVCGEATGTAGETAHDGKVTITHSAVVNAPEACAFTAKGKAGSIDVTNGKTMDSVSYQVPKGLAAKGNLITASPISTILAKELGDAEFTEAAAVEVFKKLGLDTLLNQGSVSSVEDYLKNTKSVTESLQGKDKSLVDATTMVLSDALAASAAHSDVTADDIIEVTNTIVDEVLTQYPDYPKTADGKEIYLDVKDTVDMVADGKPVVLPPPQDAKPVDPPKPPTGGTGGSEGDNNGGTGA